MITQIKRLTVVLVVLFLVAAVSGCGPKAAPSTSIMDTPEYHYKQGLKLMDEDRLDDAMREFDRAIALDPKSSLGYIGKGLILGKKGDFKPAFENMEKAKGYETKGIEARIGMIRLYGLQMAKEQKRVNELVKSAEKEFKSADEKEPNNPRLHFYMGMCYKTALDFDKAANMFRTVLDINQDFVGEANAEWAVIQKIQRAAPGSEIGKKIALIDKIDRADVAALFDQEMNLEKLFTKRGTKTYDTAFKAPTESSTRFSPDTTVKMEPATDIADNWLKPSIETILKLQVRGLEAGPNHKFEPEKIITKGEFALMLEDILIKVTGDEKLATKFIGATSPFPDVRSDYYAFNAIMTVTSRGFLEADKATGEFKAGDTVSGADALLSIREFKDQLKF
ncbi:MAG TPA: S-layer homology domain-containing protein [Nitrospirota bacterium]|nr:S-layer homology domain-containing protein [Nitrospirota bacterium]